ncbi:hypothetical protein BUALT_Bualt07G0105500 [Buddleja alternifolia]|uniref:Retrotransposon gag domain-containing protein n=1 Tax=Buddleja alternifolia TaxID=168488 RepID=A0AAV6XKH9_9LAMI|nr:hypothetical protein BUALT_Bualt07G0105500 [Buddleja alternifolia]
MVETTRSNTELRKDVDSLKESCERIEKTIEDMRNMLPKLIENQQHPLLNVNGRLGLFRDIGESPGTRALHSWGSGYEIQPKVSRVEFSHFNGEDLRGWLYKCEQFFEIDDTPPTAKVKFVVVHLEELVNLKQVANVQHYFDKFVNCLELPDQYAFNCFFGGLKSEISVNVRMFRPKSLQEAISLAKLQEQADSVSHKRPPLFSKPL